MVVLLKSGCSKRSAIWWESVKGHFGCQYHLLGLRRVQHRFRSRHEVWEFENRVQHHCASIADFCRFVWGFPIMVNKYFPRAAASSRLSTARVVFIVPKDSEFPFHLFLTLHVNTINFSPHLCTAASLTHVSPKKPFLLLFHQESRQMGWGRGEILISAGEAGKCHFPGALMRWTRGRHTCESDSARPLCFSVSCLS